MNWPETESTTPPVTPAGSTLGTPMSADPSFDEPSGAQDLKRKAHDALETGEDYVRNNPLATLVAAVAVGAVVGAILGQLGRREPEPLPVSAWQNARDWLGHTYGDVRDRMPDVPKVSVPHVSLPKHFTMPHVTMPKFQHEPTLMDRLEHAADRLRFW